MISWAVKLENAYRNSVENPEGKRQLVRPRSWWEDNIKIHLQEIGCGLDSSRTGQVPLAGFFKLGNELSGYIKVGKFSTR
jgi:hypothetical protein